MHEMSWENAQAIAERAGATFLFLSRIHGLALDSRCVKPGDLFICPDTGADTSKRDTLVHHARERGAAALFWNIDTHKRCEVITPCLKHFYPLYQPKCCVGVTGTNGKSSTVHFIRELWEKIGKSGASIGTLGILSSNKIFEERALESIEATAGSACPGTMPGELTLCALMNEAQMCGVDHCALEVSSHGLVQERLGPLVLDVGVMTNFSQDHLDYHGSMEAYWKAKLLFLSHAMGHGGKVVINTCLYGKEGLEEHSENRDLEVTWYGPLDACKALGGKWREHFLGYVVTERSLYMQTLNLLWPVMGIQETLRIPLVGDFQIENVLASIGAIVLSEGKSAFDAIKNHIEDLPPVPGRLECLNRFSKNRQGPTVCIDYAHTPDALEKALKALRKAGAHFIRLIFGCGGNRDASKRLLMGKIACEHADDVIITDDNPREEDPARIRAMIHEGCPKARIIAPRELAIQSGIIDGCPPNGAILIAGRGHERFQIIGTEKIPFSDAAWAKTFLES